MPFVYSPVHTFPTDRREQVTEPSSQQLLPLCSARLQRKVLFALLLLIIVVKTKKTLSLKESNEKRKVKAK